MSRRTLAVIVGLLAGLVAMQATADAASLYSGPGPRPGPDILYAPPATAPQLTNAGRLEGRRRSSSPARAPTATASSSTRTSSTTTTARDGQPRPGRPARRPATRSRRRTAPTPTRPTRVYANNAADLVELRVKPLADATAFRVTLNTLKDPSLVGVHDRARRLAGDAAPVPARRERERARRALPDRATARTRRAASTPRAGSPVGARRRPSTRRHRRAARSRSACRTPRWDPDRPTVRLAAGVGLWDTASDRYLAAPADRRRDPPRRRGHGRQPAGVLQRRLPLRRADARRRRPAPAPRQSPAWWRDRAQGDALPPATSAPFHADVDFAQARRQGDRRRVSGVPKTGPIDRILASHFETAQGADFSPTAASASSRRPAPGEYQGQLQPYAIYVPQQAACRPTGYGLTLLLHSLGGQLQPVPRQPQPVAVRRARPGLDRDHAARRAGPDGCYDELRRRPTCSRCGPTSRATTSSTRTGPSITGYSMGGFGTFKLAEQFPDLFARAQPTVGDSDATTTCSPRCATSRC